MARVTRASPRLRSLSVSGLVTSALRFCCVSLNFVVFWFAFVYQKILLCFGKYCCASGNFLVFWKRLLCSRIDCCVLEKIVVFFKRLLCFRTEIELCFAPVGHRRLDFEGTQCFETDSSRGSPNTVSHKVAKLFFCT